MSANFMGGPRVALARIRDSRKQRLQQNALAQGATGATTAAAGASTRRADGKGAEDDGLANSGKGKRQASQSAKETFSPSSERRKQEADDAGRGRSIDSTANKRDFNHQAGSKSGSVERASADDDDGKAKDEVQGPSRSTSPDLDQKRRLLLDHDDWLGQGEIEGILRKKRKKGESSKGKREKKKEAAATSAPGEARVQDVNDSREGDCGQREVAGLVSGEVGRHRDAPEEPAQPAATSRRYGDQGKSFTTVHDEKPSPTKLEQHSHASELLLPPTNGLPALSLHPEALYTNSIKGLFTSGALGKGTAGVSSVKGRSTTKCSAGNPYLGVEDASEGVINEAKAPLEEAPRRQARKAEAEDDGELEELEGLLSRQKEETSRRLLGDR